MNIDHAPVSTSKPAPAERGTRRRTRRLARNLSLWGGAVAAAGGTLHTVGAALMRRDQWTQIANEGFLGTISLEPPPERMALAEAFWFSPGSFGVPLATLGALTIWLTARGERVPAWVGLILLVWTGLMATIGDLDVGSGVLLTISALLVAGGWQTRRDS